MKKDENYSARLFFAGMNVKFRGWLERHSFSDSTIIIISALIVGIGAGFGAVLFRRLIGFFQTVSYDGLGGLLSGIAPYHLIIIPALGGLIFGPLIYKFAREAKGHGVPEVMEAVALKGGRIRPQVVVVKALASAICIGTGGSVGREGPIAQIGSAIGSTIGQMFHLSDEKIRNLVACGAAGGIAATFNAPIAGSIFAIEVILGRIHALNFGAVVISAVTADVIAHIFDGNAQAFIVPQYSMGDPWELGLYAILGLLAAVASVGFTRLLYFSEDLWDKIRFPEYLKPVLGGIALGVLGILTFKMDGYPRIFGVGYESITEALVGSLSLKIVFGLLLLKCLATVITLGAGGSGGIFAPSLYMGAMLGASFGLFVENIFPSITIPAGAFAMVGMAAFFSGAAHSPITAIMILFEMTGDYNIILPLMLATVLSTIVSRIISKESIYTLKLTRRGVHLESGTDIDVMQGITVGEVMESEIFPVDFSLGLSELSEKLYRDHKNFFIVLDERGKLFGVATLSDLEKILRSDSLEGKTVADMATRDGLIVTYADEPMWKALKLLVRHDVSTLPVVSHEDPQEVVGLIGRGDIVRAYRHAIAKRAEYQNKAELLKLGKLNEANFSKVEIPASSPLIGKQIRNINLPESSLIVSIRRKNSRKLIVAHGYTPIREGDQLIIFAEDKAIELVNNLLTGKAIENITKGNVLYKDVLIQAGSSCSGKEIHELNIPLSCIIVSIKRGDETIIPHGNTKVEVNDVIQIYGLLPEINKIESCFI